MISEEDNEGKPPNFYSTGKCFGRTATSPILGGLGELGRDIALSLGDYFRQDSGTGPEHKEISTAVGTVHHWDK